MKKVPLTPYPGYLFATKDRKEYARAMARCGEAGPHSGSVGQTSRIEDRLGGVVFVVLYDTHATLVHELGHVVVDLFGYINAHPSGCNGEPFAYMLGYLFEQVTKK